MPSQARLTFERHLLKDVHALIDTHRSHYTGKRGKPLSVFTRSGVFLLSAAWEIYVEEVAAEGANFVLDKIDHPKSLPKPMQEILIAAAVNRNGQDSLELAGGGWRQFFRSIVAQRTAALNTPSVERATELFRLSMGANLDPVLGPDTDALRDFIKKRGSIAHQGVKAGRVGLKNLEADYKFICNLVSKVDNALINEIKRITGHQPWNRRK